MYKVIIDSGATYLFHDNGANEINEKEDRIHYELYFNKMIGGQIKSIPSRLESDGTRRILNQFDTIIGSLLALNKSVSASVFCEFSSTLALS